MTLFLFLNICSLYYKINVQTLLATNQRVVARKQRVLNALRWGVQKYPIHLSKHKHLWEKKDCVKKDPVAGSIIIFVDFIDV